MEVLQDIAIVILNWNGQELLKQFLPSVVEHSTEASIYVIDNASTDTSVAFLKQNFPQIHLVVLDKNYGYAGGYNKGLRQIDATYFCLLNSDVEVTSGWLHPILQTFHSNPRTVAIQPKILAYRSRSEFEYAGAGGGFIDAYGYPYCRGRIFDKLEMDSGQYDDTRNIFWASGACLFIAKEAFWQVGGFDTSFFAHQEEIDLCWRLYNQNKTVQYVGTSTVYHLGGATLDKAKPQKTYLNFRNSLFMLLKNLPKGKLLTTLFIRMILDGVAAIQFLLQGKGSHFLAVFKAHISFYRQFQHYYRKRKGRNFRSNYYQHRSIVWRYFVVGRRKFTEL